MVLSNSLCVLAGGLIFESSLQTEIFFPGFSTHKQAFCFLADAAEVPAHQTRMSKFICIILSSVLRHFASNLKQFLQGSIEAFSTRPAPVSHVLLSGAALCCRSCFHCSSSCSPAYLAIRMACTARPQQSRRLLYLVAQAASVYRGSHHDA